MAIRFLPSTSPLAGKEGRYLTGRELRARLFRERKTNVALDLEDEGEAFVVRGRGELHLAVLIETIRREGYAFEVGPPRVLWRGDEEPYERLVLKLPQARLGAVISFLGERQGTLLDLGRAGDRVRAEFFIPVRGLFGFKGRFLALTGGEGVFSRSLAGYRAGAGPLPRRATASAYATEAGRAFAYALGKLKARVRFFIAPGNPVYPGMIVGGHVREGDLGVNVTKNKRLTNVRAAGSDERVRLVPPKVFGLEEALAFLAEDGRLEVTPKAIRMRKAGPKKAAKSAMSKGRALLDTLFPVMLG